MARKTLSERRSEKLAELEKIKAALAKLESQAAERIGRIAVRSGLADLELEDDRLAEEFATIVAKFRPKSGKKEKPTSSDAG